MPKNATFLVIDKHFAAPQLSIYKSALRNLLEFLVSPLRAVIICTHAVPASLWRSRRIFVRKSSVFSGVRFLLLNPNAFSSLVEVTLLGHELQGQRQA